VLYRGAATAKAEHIGWPADAQSAATGVTFAT